MRELNINGILGLEGFGSRVYLDPPIALCCPQMPLSEEEQKAHTARMKEETLERQMEQIAKLGPDTPITWNMGSILGEVPSDFLVGLNL